MRKITVEDDVLKEDIENVDSKIRSIYLIGKKVKKLRNQMLHLKPKKKKRK